MSIGIDMSDYSGMVGNVSVTVRDAITDEVLVEFTKYNRVTNNLMRSVSKYLTGSQSAVIPQYLAIGSGNSSVSSEDTQLDNEYRNPGTGQFDRISLSKRAVQYDPSQGYSVAYGVTIPYASHNGNGTYEIRELGLYADAVGTSSLMSRVIMPASVVVTKKPTVIIDIDWILKLIPVSSDSSVEGVDN